MNHVGWIAVALASLVTACVNSSEGSPVADEGRVSSATSAPGSSAPSSSTGSAPGPDPAQPGVVPTTSGPARAGSTCEMPIAHPVEVVATVPDVAAPKITVALPEGWSTSAGEGDVGARFTGPDGMWAMVTIAETTLPPAVAFENYADDATEATEISALSVLPADLCGYSGQKLLGSRADTAQQAVEFGDRLAHIPTTSADYLVAVHVEAPTGTADFDPLTSPLLGDFGIVIP